MQLSRETFNSSSEDEWKQCLNAYFSYSTEKWHKTASSGQRDGALCRGVESLSLSRARGKITKPIHLGFLLSMNHWLGSGPFSYLLNTG